LKDEVQKAYPDTEQNSYFGILCQQ